jgi:cytochrome c oxidase cbb3-type subunit III
VVGLRFLCFLAAASLTAAEGDPVAGQKLFAAACATCHGKSGEGARGPNLADGGLVRRLNDQRLFSSIKNGIPGSDMPGFSIGDDKVWHVVRYLRSLNSPAMNAGVPGDVKAGRELFFNKGQCSSCHMLRGEGGFLGPDLTNIGEMRTVKRLRESLDDPSARIVEGFGGATVTLKNGSKLNGIVKNSNNYSIQLLDAKGGLHLLDMGEVEKFEQAQDSIMPAVSKRLSPEETQNLLAFLASQGVRR